MQLCHAGSKEFALSSYGDVVNVDDHAADEVLALPQRPYAEIQSRAGPPEALYDGGTLGGPGCRSVVEVEQRRHQFHQLARRPAWKASGRLLSIQRTGGTL